MITLYDIGPAFINGQEIGTSPFVRRVIYTLNYKKLPYKLKLLSYEAVEPTAKSIRAPPTGVRADGTTPRYTVPFIHDQDSDRDVAVSDSMRIAEYLDNTYPDTPTVMTLDTPEFSEVVGTKFRPLYPVLGPKMREILSPALLEGQRKLYGDPAPALSKEKEAEAWEAAKEGFASLSGYHKEGNEAEGKLTFGHFSIASFVWFANVLYGKDSKELQEVRSWAGGWVAQVFDKAERHPSMQV
ncbi:hypothetical protein WG66_011436 [Moniliophthora roreri]|uniref:GST N-terminal domain-containing protein n=1 Tax=Moniliophthora roreri TaxID=221103 RepID=A0A0W0F408_MONRR|nr:hypothetical protein WG66_011436 [Moniliophthora roreri]